MLQQKVAIHMAKNNYWVSPDKNGWKATARASLQPAPKRFCLNMGQK